MKRAAITCLILPLLLAATGDGDGMKLAREVVKASGGDDWGKVARIQFTFNVLDKDGKPAMTAKHDWNLRAGTDAVTWNGKTVTIKLSDKNDAGDAKAAYQRWVNDT